MFTYQFFWENKAAILPYLLLALAILSLWVKRHPGLWGGLLVLAVITGFLTKRLLPESLITLIALGLSYYFYFQASRERTRFLAGLLACVVSLLILFFHKMPGFQNLLAVEQLKITPDATPYSSYLNFDKPLIGLYILGFGFSFVNQSFSKKSFRALPSMLLTFAAMSILALLTGYVVWEPKWTPLFYYWVVNNLLFVCVAEEVFFRGFVQQTLVIKLKHYRLGYLIAILAASLLFGLLHFRGGMIYIALSSIAGIFYGAVYFKSGRIEFSIATHFILNTIHFLLFTYPALQS